MPSILWSWERGFNGMTIMDGPSEFLGYKLVLLTNLYLLAGKVLANEWTILENRYWSQSPDSLSYEGWWSQHRITPQDYCNHSDESCDWTCSQPNWGNLPSCSQYDMHLDQTRKWTTRYWKEEGVERLSAFPAIVINNAYSAEGITNMMMRSERFRLKFDNQFFKSR